MVLQFKHPNQRQGYTPLRLGLKQHSTDKVIHTQNYHFGSYSLQGVYFFFLGGELQSLKILFSLNNK